jgi:hypothetical protein
MSGQLQPNPSIGHATPTTTVVRRTRSPYAQPAFIVAVVVLGIGALGLNAATNYLKLNFKKVPVALRHGFDDADGIPARVGDWQMVSIDMPVNADLEEALGTKEYVFRDYVDTRLVSERELARFNDKSDRERRGLVAELQQRKPTSVVRLAVTYYTGYVDTVPHVPERCYVADAFRPVDPLTYEWPVPTPILGPEPLSVRYIDFEDQTGNRVAKVNVAYFFQTQGAYESNPLLVRGRLQNLFEPYGYFAKVELMTVLPDREQAAKVMQDFLRASLPEVERCLPDFKAIKAGRPTTQPAVVATTLAPTPTPTPTLK